MRTVSKLRTFGHSPAQVEEEPQDLMPALEAESDAEEFAANRTGEPEPNGTDSSHHS